MALPSNDNVGQMIDAFPYPPYDIQRQLMINIYTALQGRQIGLFESPTGTGKTLSVICSVLKWLEDERSLQQARAAAASEAESGLPDWMQGFAASATATIKPQSNAQHAANNQFNRKQSKAPVILDENGVDVSDFLIAEEADAAGASSLGSKRTAADAGYINSSSDEEADTAPPEQPDTAQQQPAAVKPPQVIFCSRTHSQLSQFVGELHRTRYAESVMLVTVGSRKALCVNDEVLKLQDLSQVNERCLDLQRSKSSSGSSRKAAAVGSDPGTVTFMRAGSSSSRRRQKQPGSGGCPYLAVSGGSSGWDQFTDMILAAPVDVEELANMGRKRKVCPYYGSRRAVPQVDVILAPYSAVLMPDARDSLGIRLDDAVVVFDEAHNLLDAINGAHSSGVSGWQLLSVQRSLTGYYERFKSHLNPINAQNIQLMLKVAAALHTKLTQQGSNPTGTSGQGPGGGAAGGRVVAVNDLLFELGIDNINLFELTRWVKDNKIAFKVSGYTAATSAAQSEGLVQLQQQQKQTTSKSSANAASNIIRQPTQQQQQQQQQVLSHPAGPTGVTAIHSFVSFLLSLTNSDADGRIIIEPPPAATTATDTSLEDDTPAAVSDQTAAAAAAAGASTSKSGRIRYVLLNAASHFGRVLSKARSVLLVSGTLAPISGLRAQLFPDTPHHMIRHFECGHVVPADHLLAVAVGRGPTGRQLKLRHDQRGDVGVVDDLGAVLLNLCGVVPEGLVVFVPSFGYLEQVTARWISSGVMERMKQRKKVFREPRSTSEVEQVLSAYAAAIEAANNSISSSDDPASTSSSCSGAVLLCVVGGKLSEGINFGDGLGRCVVILGMPYPNPSDPEIRERMAYLDKQVAAAASTKSIQGATLQQQQQPDEHQLPASQQVQQLQAEPTAAALPVKQRSVFQNVQVAGKQSGTAADRGQGSNSSSIQHTTADHSNMQHQQHPVEHTQPVAAAQGTSSAAGPAAIAAGVADSSSGSSQHTVLLTGRDYYEDLCFKAVNQCVGRVVRHKDDYAAVVLVDSRWVVGPADWQAVARSAAAQATHNVQTAEVSEQQQQQGPAGAASISHPPALDGTNRAAGGLADSSTKRRVLPVQKLPGWVQRSFMPSSGEFGPAYKQLAQFFKDRRQQQQQQQQQQ